MLGCCVDKMCMWTALLLCSGIFFSFIHSPVLAFTITLLPLSQHSLGFWRRGWDPLFISLSLFFFWSSAICESLSCRIEACPVRSERHANLQVCKSVTVALISCQFKGMTESVSLLWPVAYIITCSDKTTRCRFHFGGAELQFNQIRLLPCLATFMIAMPLLLQWTGLFKFVIIVIWILNNSARLKFSFLL